MTKLDDMIEEALSAEDEALLARYGREPGYVSQAFGLFRGRLGWVMWVVFIAQFLAVLGAVYALVRLFSGAPDMLEALRHGVLAVILIQLATFLRGFMGAHFEANRVLREIKRLELRLVRLEERGERNGRSGDPA